MNSHGPRRPSMPHCVQHWTPFRARVVGPDSLGPLALANPFRAALPHSWGRSENRPAAGRPQYSRRLWRQPAANLSGPVPRVAACGRAPLDFVETAEFAGPNRRSDAVSLSRRSLGTIARVEGAPRAYSPSSPVQTPGTTAFVGRQAGQAPSIACPIRTVSPRCFANIYTDQKPI